MSEYKQNHHNSEKTDGGTKVPTHRSARRDAGSSAAADSHAAGAPPLRTGAAIAAPSGEAQIIGNSFTAKTWVRVLSVLLSVLLALTMFDATAMVSYADELPGDEAIEIQGDPSHDEAEGEDEAAQDATENPLAWTDSAQEHDLDADILADLLPEDRVAAAEVVPIVTARTMAAEDPHAVVDADIAARVAPNVLAWGAPYHTQSGFFAKGERVRAVYDLGNLRTLLEGGFLGGSREGDRFALTLDVPFLYVDDGGRVATTFSEEEWRLRTALAAEVAAAAEGNGAESYEEAIDRAAQRAADSQDIAAAPRTAIFADAVPRDWSLWQEHDGSYVRISDEQMSAGVSGRLIFIYEGNGGRLEADAELPAFDLGFAGTVPADAVASVHFGYEAHSFTGRTDEGESDPVTVYGDAKRASVASYGLVNRAEPLSGSLSAEVYRAPSLARTDDGSSTGYLTIMARYAMGSASARGWALDAAFRADWNGQGGLTVEQLAAYSIDDEGNVEANLAEDGTVRTDEDFLAETSFVGVPGHGGVIATDVTGLTEEEIASIDPANGESLDALGLECVPYTISPDGMIRVASEEGSGAIGSEEERTILLAVPYEEASLAAADQGDGFAPVEVRLDLQAAVVSHGESFFQAQLATVTSDV